MSTRSSLINRGRTLPGGYHLFHYEDDDGGGGGGGGGGKKKTTDDLLQDLVGTMTELKTEIGTIKEGQGSIVTRMDASDKMLEELKKGGGDDVDGKNGDEVDGKRGDADGDGDDDGGGVDEGSGGVDGNGKGFDLEKHPAFKKMQKQLEEQSTTITAQAESLKTMEKERDDARQQAAKGTLSDAIKKAAGEAGITDETARQEFVDAKIHRFKLGDSGELQILDGGGNVVRSKTHPTENMGHKEFFNGEKISSSHWWNSSKGNKSHKNTGGDGGSGGDGEGGDDDGGGDGTRIVNDVAEWQKLKSSSEGRKEIKQGKAVFRPAA